MHIPRPTRGWALIVGGGLAFIAAALLAVSVWMPVRRATPRMVVGLDRRELVVAWASAPGNPAFFSGYVDGMRFSGKAAPAWRPREMVGRAKAGTGVVTYTIVTVPLVAMLAAAVMLAGVAWVPARKVAPPPGHCAACGYDLKGLTSSNCPECGGLVARLLGMVAGWLRLAQGRTF